MTLSNANGAPRQERVIQPDAVLVDVTQSQQTADPAAPTMAPAEPAGPTEQPARRQRVIKIPNDQLGHALNGSRDAPYAVAMLADKCRHGPTYVLNQKNLAKPRSKGGLGLSRRGFFAGRRVLTASGGPLARWQPERGYKAFARERWAPSSTDETWAPEDLHLTGSWRLFAFVAAVLLNPNPQSAARAAARAGVKARDTVNRLIKEALAEGRIAARKMRGHGWIVARPGVDLSAFEAFAENGDAADADAKTGHTATGHTATGHTHSNRKKAHNGLKKDHSQLNNNSPADLDQALLAEELLQADWADALAGHLLTRSGLRGYHRLVAKFPGVAHMAIVDVLGRLATDGAVPGQVKTWKYFEGACADEAKRALMEAQGIRPGDVSCLHRSRTVAWNQAAQGAQVEPEAPEPATRAPRAPAPTGVGEEEGSAGDAPVVLRDWRASDFWRHRPMRFAGEIKIEQWDRGEWKTWLERSGGAPAHLATPAAFRQAVEIAHELAELAQPVALGHGAHRVLRGLAFWVCRAHHEGKPIRSLAFIAQNLAQRCDDRDLTWLTDYPSGLPEAEVAQAQQLAERLLGALDRAGVPVHRHPLLSTTELERLALMGRCLGFDVLEANITRVIESGAKPVEGNSIAGWHWFEDHVAVPELERMAAAMRDASNGAPAKIDEDVDEQIADALLREILGTVREMCDLDDDFGSNDPAQVEKAEKVLCTLKDIFASPTMSDHERHNAILAAVGIGS
jgi:hypothetical protein